MPEPYRPPIHRPRDLAGILMDPGWADAEAAQCLVLDLTAARTGSPSAEERAWLSALPIPVVGVEGKGTAAWIEAVDVLVATEDELDLVLDGIRRNPVASAVLVQVLRSVGRLPVTEALALESLGYATLQSGEEFARWLAGRDATRRRKREPPGGDAVRLERRGARLDLVLNAPHNRNALSVPMRDGLTEAFRLVAMDTGIRRVEVRANGPCFSSGGDLTEFGTASDPSHAHRIRMRRMPARYLAPCAERYHVHVHGACVGAGIELSAFAARVTAADDAFFQLPELAMGLIPGAGGCVSIPRRIGRQRTALMAFTNRRVDARQALEWGLVDAIED